MATATGTNVKFVKVATKQQYTDYTDKDGALIFVESERKIYVDGVAYGFSDSDVANKFLELTGGYMTGSIDMGSKDINSIGELRGIGGAAIEFDGYNKIVFNGPVARKILEIEEVADETQAKVIRFGADVITGIPDPEDATSPVNVAFLDSQVLSKRGVAGGFATLDESKKVPAAQLPSYVDDVVEYSKRADFPATGEEGKLYVAIDTNALYRWSGSTYVMISDGQGHLVLGTTASTAFRGDYGKTAYDHALLTSGNPHGVTASNVGLGSVVNQGLATKAQAEAGTINTAYMTPLRTKEAITKLAPKLSWTVVA